MGNVCTANELTNSSVQKHTPRWFNIAIPLDLIDELSNCVGGTITNNVSFNVFCYTDDMLLTSLTASGLQRMIDLANRYITDHGLNFNPSKTVCAIFGNDVLYPHPERGLNGVTVRIRSNIWM